MHGAFSISSRFAGRIRGRPRHTYGLIKYYTYLLVARSCTLLRSTCTLAVTFAELFVFVFGKRRSRPRRPSCCSLLPWLSPVLSPLRPRPREGDNQGRSCSWLLPTGIQPPPAYLACMPHAADRRGATDHRWSALPERDEQAVAPHALRHRAVRLRVRVRVRVRLGLGLGSALGLGLGLGSALGLGFGFGLGSGLSLTLVYVPVPWNAPSCHWPG